MGAWRAGKIFGGCSEISPGGAAAAAFGVKTPWNKRASLRRAIKPFSAADLHPKLRRHLQPRPGVLPLIHRVFRVRSCAVFLVVLFFFGHVCTPICAENTHNIWPLPLGERALFLLQTRKRLQTYAASLIYCVAFTGMMKQILALTIYRHTTVNTNKCSPASPTHTHKHTCAHTHRCTNAPRLCAPVQCADGFCAQSFFLEPPQTARTQEEHAAAAAAAAPPVAGNFEFVRLDCLIRKLVV